MPIIGPWKCEQCGNLSQYAVATDSRNTIFCRNESCGFKRIVDKREFRIVENDGTVWVYDGHGNKRQVRMRA